MRDRRYSSTALWRGQRERLKYVGLLAAIGTALVIQPAKAEETAAATTDAKSGTAVLAPINVQANTENEGPLGPVIQQDSSTATKTDTPIKDTPRSISVETRQQMTDKGALRVVDTYLYSAGVHGGNYGVDARGNWASVRGFEAADYLDGLQYANDGYYNDTLPEVEMLERVEILKGPASALYGATGVGGLINLVSKRPQEDSFRRATIEYGSFARKQATIDMNGKLDENGKILGRVVALWRDAGTQVANGRNDAELIAPSITFRPDADTDITVLARYEHTDITPDNPFSSLYGTLLPAPNGEKLSSSTSVAEPGFDKLNSKTYALMLDASRNLGEVWTLNGKLRYSHSVSDYNHTWWGYTNYPTRWDSSNEIDRAFYKQHGATYMWLADANAVGRFDTGPVNHELLIGANFTHIKFDNDHGSCYQADPTDPTDCAYGIPRFDPFNPVYTGAPAIDVVDYPSVLSKQTGFYIQDQATIYSRVVLAGGLRWDKFETTDPFAGAGALTNEDHDLTGNASLLYKFDAGFSPYVSYAESFRQETYEKTFTGEMFKPTRGEQWEFGLKYQPPGTSSLFTIAYFDLTKSNTSVADPLHPTYNIQTGEAKSHGVEIEAQTRIEDFYIEANYSFVQTRGEDGGVIATVPKHLASAWVTWRPEGPIKGFKMGGGVRYVGPNYGTHYDSSWNLYRLTVPSYTLGDAMIGFETADWDITLNAQNLTDREYVTTAVSNSGYWGPRRNIVLKLGYNF